MYQVIFNTHDVVLLMTAYQCILFAILLLTIKREKPLSNFFLAFFLLQQAAIPLDILISFGAEFRNVALSWSPNLFYVLSILLLVGFAFEAWFSRQKLVPFFVFFLLTIYFGYTLFRNRFKPHLTKFYISYFIVLIPFFLIKLVLNSLPVILYNSDFTLGIRLAGVPVEQFANLFLLMLINITIFEYLRDNHLY